MNAPGDLPPPPVPPDCDLRDFQFMPLMILRLRRSRSWLMAKRQPELGFYMLNLWTASWHEAPAASLENDDDVLADMAMCEITRWPAVREQVLRGWIKCSDGRLYHPLVAEKALDAWKLKTMQRERSAKGAAARWGAQAITYAQSIAPSNAPSMPQAIPKALPKASPNHANGMPQALPQALPWASQDDPEGIPQAVDEQCLSIACVLPRERERESERERKEDYPSLRSAENAANNPPDPRAELFTAGLETVRRLTRKSEPLARSLIGRWLKAARDDAPAVSAAIAAAEVAAPADPVPWIFAALGRRVAPGPEPAGVPDAEAPADPWRSAAWIASLPDAVPGTHEGRQVPSLNGYVLAAAVEAVCAAARIPPTVAPRLDAVADWCRAGLDFDTPAVLGAIERQASAMAARGDWPRSLAVFDGLVRTACAAIPAGAAR